MGSKNGICFYGIICLPLAPLIFKFHLKTIVKALKEEPIEYLCQLDNKLLIAAVSLYYDYYLIPIDIKQGFKNLAKLNGHKDKVVKVIQLTNQRMASCSYDSIIIWEDHPPFNKITTLYTSQVEKDKKEKLHSIIEIKQKNCLISGTNEVLRVWELSEYQAIELIKDVSCYERECLIQFGEDKLIVGGVNEISIIDLNTFSVYKKISPFFPDSCVTSLLQIDKESFIAGDCFGNLFRLTVTSDRVLNKYKYGHEIQVTSLLKLDDRLFISTSWGSSIKIWSL